MEKTYESDKNSAEDLEPNESVDEYQQEDMAGFNINTGSKSQKSSQGEDEEGDSSDPLDGFA